MDTHFCSAKTKCEIQNAATYLVSSDAINHLKYSAETVRHIIALKSNLFGYVRRQSRF